MKLSIQGIKVSVQGEKEECQKRSSFLLLNKKLPTFRCKTNRESKYSEP
jgi:hypothetical protein